MRRVLSDLRIYPDHMGETLDLTAFYSPEDGIILTNTIEIEITGPNLRSTELDYTNLYLKSCAIKDISGEIIEEGKFLCSTEEVGE